MDRRLLGQLEEKGVPNNFVHRGCGGHLHDWISENGHAAIWKWQFPDLLHNSADDSSFIRIEKAAINTQPF